MKVGGKRNFGRGRTLSYAVRNVLRERFGDKRYGTRHSHLSRLKPFLEYMKVEGIRDLQDVSRATVLSYSRILRQFVDDEELALATAVNRVSSVNVLLETLHGDKKCSVSPRAVIGPRTRVRQEAPPGIDIDIVLAAVAELAERGDIDVAKAVTACRLLGCRIREAALLDYRQAAKSAADKGKVVVRRGSKGGRARKIPREIVASAVFVDTLQQLQAQQPGRSLVPDGQTFRNWYLSAYRRYAPVAMRFGLATGFHDLRAAYACVRYQEITGDEAPCVAGHREASCDRDRLARDILATDLGHARTDVVASYVGAGR
jgi:hypothetical protein